LNTRVLTDELEKEGAVKIEKGLPIVFHDAETSASVERVLSASLHAVDPYQAVIQALDRQGTQMAVDDVAYNLETIERVLVVSLGKAAGLMAKAAADVLGDKLVAGIVVQKMDASRIVLELPGGIEVFQGNHPVPGEGSLAAGAAVLSFLGSCTSSDLVIFLISGGGSALLTYPHDGIGLEDLQNLTRSLLECGAQIDEINTIRKHMDGVKGGGLAGATAPARMLTLVLSDVVGNPLDMIASGPTVADPTTYMDAKAILEKYQLWQHVPASISAVLNDGLAGERPETRKPGSACFRNAQVVVVGSNYQAACAGLGAARREGMHAQILTTFLQGDAFNAGRFLGSLLHQIDETGQPLSRPVCLIAGGETTVVVEGDGLGGRNLEVALGAVAELDGLEHVALVTLATDGEDGPTDAAGAVVTGKTLQQALDSGLKLEAYRANSDSYHFFDALGALIQIGSTGTNVNDLAFLFAF
jgi:glycerate 2-kinase